MFGIGIQEMLVIFVVALIVVGPDKLPGLARSLAKGFVEIRKTLEQAKESLNLESDMLETVKRDLKESSDKMRDVMIEAEPDNWRRASGPVSGPADEIIDIDNISKKGQSALQVRPPEAGAALSFPDRQSSGHGSAYALPAGNTPHFTPEGKAGKTSSVQPNHD